MVRLNIDILRISELKWKRMGDFNSDDHYIYYCGQESLRRNGVSIIVNKRIWNAILGCNLIIDRMILVHFQGKTFNVTAIQVYCFPLFLCIDPWGRLSYFSLLFIGTLHPNGYIFSFFLCLSLLFFSQMFVRPPQTTILPFCTFFFLGDGLNHCLLYNVTNLCP